MKLALRRLLGLALALCLVISSAGLGALADDIDTSPTPEGISVQLNGENITFVDATPQMQNDRVFLPIRRLCELIGAEVISFDENTNTVVIGKDGAKVTFVNGKTGMTIEDPDGEIRTVETDVASYEDKTYFRTMVPVRFLSEALGLNVGWDNENQTVLLLDTTALTDQLAGKFSLMNQYQSSSIQQTIGKTFAVTGDAQIDLQLEPQMTQTEQAVALHAAGTLSGLTSETATQLDLNLNFNLDELLAQMTEEELADPATQDMIAALQDMRMQYIMDLNAGDLYLNMGNLSSMILPEATAESWFSVDLAELLETFGIDFNSLMELNSASVTFEETMGSLFSAYPLTSVNDYALLQQLVDQLLAMFGDDSFVKQGSRYVSTYNLEQNGVQMVLKTTLSASSDTIDRIELTLSVTADGQDILGMQISCQENLDTALTMSLTIADTMSMDLSMTLGYEGSDQAPATKPADGTDIIPLDFGPILAEVV